MSAAISLGAALVVTIIETSRLIRERTDHQETAPKIHRHAQEVGRLPDVASLQLLGFVLVTIGVVGFN